MHRSSSSSPGLRATHAVVALTTWLSLPERLANRRLRRETRALYEKLRAENDESFVHPLWSEVRPIFVDFVRSGVPPDFLQHPLVRHMLYRTGLEELEQIEVDYLEQLDEPSWAAPRLSRARVWRAAIRQQPTGRSVTTLKQALLLCADRRGD